MEDELLKMITVNDTDSYAASNGIEVIDWNKAIDLLEDWINVHDARARDLISLLDFKSGSWITCACGSQCHVIPRGDLGGPKDPELNRLGIAFMYAFDDIKFFDANATRRTLQLIELRSAQLIKEIEGGKNEN